jgi:ribosomal protein S18 acetylase RimI-like enzyme
VVIGPERYDSEDAATLIDALSAELDRRYGAEDDAGQGWRAEVGPADVTPPAGVFLVARVDGEAVGCGAVKRHADGVGEVKRMYVAPAGRRRGLGRILLAELEHHAASLGYRVLRLETGEAQPEAMALYESAGFRRIPNYGRYADDPRTASYDKALTAPSTAGG